jgi:hypothetical protein
MADWVGAQYNTQMYGKRPYGVGFLVIGQDVSPSPIAHNVTILICVGDWTTPFRVFPRWNCIRVLCPLDWCQKSERKDVPGKEL